MSECCGTCRFHRDDRCRRVPPTWVHHSYMSGPIAEQPRMNYGEWCGEFEPACQEEIAHQNVRYEEDRRKRIERMEASTPAPGQSKP